MQKHDLVQPRQLPQFLTVIELALLIKRNKFTIYHQLAKEPEKLPKVTRLHGRVLFLEADVHEWFDEVCGAAPAAMTPPPAATRPRGRPRKASQLRACATGQHGSSVHQ